MLFWDRLGLDAGLQFPINKVLDESSDVLLGESVAFEWILLVLNSLLDGERREFVGRKVKVTSVAAKSLCVNGSKVDDTLVLLSNWSQSLSK